MLDRDGHVPEGRGHGGTQHGAEIWPGGVVVDDDDRISHRGSVADRRRSTSTTQPGRANEKIEGVIAVVISKVSRG